MKKLKQVMGRLRALPKLLHRRQAGGNEGRESTGARVLHPSSGRHPAKHPTANRAHTDPSLEKFIAAVFEATGHRMTEEQADRLRRSMVLVEEPGKTPNPATDGPASHGPSGIEPAAVPSQFYGPREAHPYSAEPAPPGFPAPAPAAPGYVGDPGFIKSPSPARDELMNGAREIQRGVTGQTFGLSQSDMAELLSLIRQLGQLFFQQGRDKVTHQQLQNEIGNLKRLIESKGK